MRRDLSPRIPYQLALGDGFEPPSEGSEPSILPLDDPSTGGPSRIRTYKLAAFETAALPFSYRPIMGRR